MWEKAGINVSVVYGSMPAEAYRAATSQNGSSVCLPYPFPHLELPQPLIIS